jgi:hypothetical protein
MKTSQPQMASNIPPALTNVDLAMRSNPRGRGAHASARPSPPKGALLPSSNGSSVRRRVATVREDSGDGMAAAASSTFSAAEAMYDYVAQEPDEVSLRAGESVQVLGSEDGWSRVKKGDGSVGLAPENHIKL